MEIRIETSVCLKSENDVAREYTASCVTGTMDKLVKFRVNAVRLDSEKDTRGVRFAYLLENMGLFNQTCHMSKTLRRIIFLA